MAGARECGNEKCGEFLDEPRTGELLRRTLLHAVSC